MIKLILLCGLFSVVFGGYAHQGHGYGHGWRRPYHGYGWVNVHQTPYAYQYGLNEHGHGYNKYIWQGADYHNSHPVKYATHGHGGYH